MFGESMETEREATKNEMVCMNIFFENGVENRDGSEKTEMCVFQAHGKPRRHREHPDRIASPAVLLLNIAPRSYGAHPSQDVPNSCIRVAAQRVLCGAFLICMGRKNGGAVGLWMGGSSHSSCR